MTHLLLSLGRHFRGAVPLQSLPQLVGVTVDGIAFGLFLALLGVGVTLVFGLGEVLNLAIGTFAIIGAVAAAVIAGGGTNPIIAAIVGIALVGVLGLVVDRTVLSLVYRSDGEERILLGIFTTLGLTILLEGILFNLYPGRYRLALGLPTLSEGGVRLTSASLLLIAVATILLVGLFLFLDRMFLGRATRTIFQDETGALLVGVPPRQIRSLVFVLSSVVAAIAGVMYAIGTPVRVVDGLQFTNFGLIVSIVGGIRSVRGAIVAGIILGLVVQYANFLLGSYQAQVILFLSAVAVIVYDPEVLS